MATHASSLSALCSELLRVAPGVLLDAPLDALSEHTEDETAHELLAGAFESGEAATLRELLSDGRLERFVDTSCTAREEQRLREQLARWSGVHASPHDDPERLVRLTDPPEQRDELARWSREHGLTEEFKRLLAELRSQDAGRAGSLLAADEEYAELRSELIRKARAGGALAARSALWKAPAPASLALLAQRLRVAVGERALAELSGVRFLRSQPVALDTDSGVVRARLAASDGAYLDCTLFLSGYEQRALEVQCACAVSQCLHGSALAARLYDACVGPDDRLHAGLLRFCEAPSWRRFLDTVRGTQSSAKERSEELAFRLRVAEDGTLSVGAFLCSLTVRSDRGVRLVSARNVLRSLPASSDDRSVLEALAARGRGPSAQFVTADLTILRSLAEHPRLSLDGSKIGLSVSEERLSVTLAELPEGILPGLSLLGVSLAGSEPKAGQQYVFALDRAASRLVFAELTPALRRLLVALRQFRGVLPKESFPALASALAGLRHAAHVPTPTTLLGHERASPRRLSLRLWRAPTEGVDITLTMSPLPLGAAWPPGRGPELVHGVVEGVHAYVRRDLEFERALANKVISALAVNGSMRFAEFSYHVPDDQEALALLDAAARLHESLDLVWAEPDRALVNSGALQTADLSIRLFKKGDWFVLEGRDSVRAEDVPLISLFEAARRGERFVKIEGNNYLEIAEELRERLLRVEPMAKGVENELRLAANALPRVVESLGGDGVELDADARAVLAGSARKLDDAELTLPENMELRAYQRDGVRFLLQRSAWASGVCLADEMGLGKTVQCIALLWARRAHGPQIVVAPTSVVGNWEAELTRFAPLLKVIVYLGPDRRARLSTLGPETVLVTSYDVLLRDRTVLTEHTYATQIVDEAQWIKNARTARFRAVDAIDAKFRVALTGTPLENRIGDVFSLFALVAPGLLGGWSRFRARFAVPIERYEDSDRSRALRELVAPFVLRREKRDVLQELPPRTEVVHRVELSLPERELYGAAVREARRALDLRGRDPRIPRIKVLAELTRLRQLACHPRLVLEAPSASSSKQRALLALLEDLLPRGHRVLIFSQFTRHLALTREALETRGIALLELTGSTPALERKARVDAFQAGAAQVFLISLKAGGAGLNLTSADYVIHLDPWWNPAAEDQASDRVHRIGQTKPVTVVKLVCEGTVEEKVLGLHAHKRRLFASVFEGENLEEPVPASELSALLRDDDEEGSEADA